MAGEINNSVGYDAGQYGSGVGAAVLTPNSRDLSQINADWNLQNQKDADKLAQDEKDKIANTKALMGDINFDTKGSLDSDAPYFAQKVQENIGKHAKLLQKYNGNPTSPEALTELAYLNGEKQGLKTEIQQSVGHKEELAKTRDALLNDKAGLYDKDATNNFISTFRVHPLQERQKMLDEHGGTFLVENPLNLSKELDSHITKNIQPDITYDKPEVIDGMLRVVSHKGYSPEQMEAVGKSQYNNNPRVQKAANTQFDDMERSNPLLKNQLVDRANEINGIAQKEGKPQNMVTPQQLIAIDAAKERAYGQSTIKSTETPQSKLNRALTLAKYRHDNPTATTDDYFYDQGLKTVNGDKNAFGGDYQYLPSGDLTVTGESVLNGKSLGTSKIPTYTKGKDGALIATGAKDISNKIRATVPIYKKNADGSVAFDKTLYVTDEMLANKGLDPSAISNQQAQANAEEWGAPLTRQVLDNVITSEKMKPKLVHYYEQRKSYSNQNPNPQTAVTVTQPPVPEKVGLPPINNPHDLANTNIQKIAASESSKVSPPKANTQDEFNAHWASAKKGDKVVGPDGKTYVKK